MDMIENVEQLRESYGAPSTRALKKQPSRLDKHCRDFIARSPHPRGSDRRHQRRGVGTVHGGELQDAPLLTRSRRRRAAM